ncbi:MAG: hypothetical protein WCJ02_11060 [bacterium]
MNVNHFMCVIVSLVFSTVLIGCGKGEKSTESTGAVKAAATVQLTAAFEKIKGKWVRSDGGYVLEFKQLLQNNTLDVAYFNPSPIHVGKARIYEERGFTKVFVELQDVNYPGSRYTLILNADKNQLIGNYFQATQQVDYEVAFDKM